MQQRRQDILSALIAAALLSFLGSVSVGGILMVVHAVIDIALVLYLGALLTIKRREQMRAQVGVLYQAPQQFNSVMPALGLSDDDIANVLTYVYSSWGNSKKVVTPAEVKAVKVGSTPSLKAHE